MYYLTRYSYYFTRYCLRTAGLMWKSEKANSSKIWPRCTAVHNSDRKVLSPWHYKVLKTSMHKGPIWECNLKFRFKLICFGTIHTLRQEKDRVNSKNWQFLHTFITVLLSEKVQECADVIYGWSLCCWTMKHLENQFYTSPQS